jgi:hypothetical protein
MQTECGAFTLRFCLKPSSHLQKKNTKEKEEDPNPLLSPAYLTFLDFKT